MSLDVLMLQRLQKDLVGLDTLVLCSLRQSLQWCTRSYRTIIWAMEKDSGEHGHELGIPAWPIAEVFINLSMGSFMRLSGRQIIEGRTAAKGCIPMG